MAEPTFDSLIVPALGALASAPNGAMTRADFVSHLETRHGSTEESADDAQSPESRSFRDTVEALIGETPDSLIGQGFAQVDASGGMITITPEGRAFIGR